MTPRLRLDSAGLVTAYGDIAVGGEIQHYNDSNTKIAFTTDQIDFTAGGVTMLTLDETTQDTVIINTAGADVDFRVESDTNTHALFVDAALNRVGINQSAPEHQLDVADDQEYGFPARVLNTSTTTSADGLRIQVMNTANPGSIQTFLQMRNASAAVGKITGDGAGGVTFSDAFTGQHPTVTSDLVGSLMLGLIMSSTGVIWNKNEETCSTGLPKVSLASTDNDADVYGVLSKIETGSDPEELTYGGYHAAENIGAGETALVVNSIGEGLVWVTDKNGELQSGDYICSTIVPGLGGKQADDLLHNYTVAKCVETIDWSSVTDTIDHDGVTYKKYLVACTYNCG